LHGGADSVHHLVYLGEIGKGEFVVAAEH
jgi:hypothetical protein